MENDLQMFVCGVPISKGGNLMISANLVIKCAIAFAIVIGMFVSHKINLEQMKPIKKNNKHDLRTFGESNIAMGE